MDPALKLHEMVEVDSADAPEPFKPEDGSRPFALPATIAILPIRSAVAFPGTVMPLAIGRARSKQLMKDVTPHQTIFGLVAQKNPDTDDPGPDDLYRVGTAASVLKIIQMPQGSLNVIVHAIARFEVVEFIGVKPYIKARVRPLEVTVKRSKKLLALMMNVKAIATRVIHLSPNVPDEAANLLESIDDASALADFLSATLAIPVPEKQALLEQTDSNKRLERISVALANQLEVLELSHKIQGQIRDSIDKSQREYFLQEELKAIQAELGEADKRTQEIAELQEKIKKAAMPDKVEKAAREELDRLGKIPLGTPEYGVIRTYLDWMCDLPWSRNTEDSLDIRKAERILNRDHFGLEKVKRRILEFLAVRKLNPKGKSPILCFVGPPGVGKTSLGQSIARAMNRKFVRISLGGIRDEADIRGHRRTYIGALPGRILQELKKCSVRNPVFMLDEMDKIGQDFRGDPASALLEVLDPQQNDSFTDHYLDQPFNLADVMFIGTANSTEPIPPALEDRMEIIELPGYTDREKLQIAKRYLIPRQLKENGLSSARLRISDADDRPHHPRLHPRGRRSQPRTRHRLRLPLGRHPRRQGPLPRRRHRRAGRPAQNPRPAPLRLRTGPADQHPRRRHRPGLDPRRRRNALRRVRRHPRQGGPDPHRPHRRCHEGIRPGRLYRRAVHRLRTRHQSRPLQKIRLPHPCPRRRRPQGWPQRRDCDLYLSCFTA